MLASLPEAVTQQVLVYMVHRVQTVGRTHFVVATNTLSSFQMTTAYDKHKAQLRAAKDKCAAFESAAEQARAVRRDRDRLAQLLSVKTNGMVQLKAETDALQKQLASVNITAAKLARQVEVLERTKCRGISTVRSTLQSQSPSCIP
ncbi:hypothetical protein DYB32_003231 [Aphanomyces invadans]|uniref:Uncharacterized protein n=1 Tax=Aphanomyces invadans TaxID=157072 RepID=A0A418B133_9STRA|nr:hypothetical protein DYB32_003231 [Aphanomyces invadans]